MRILQMVDVPGDSGLAHYALVLGQGLKARGHQVWVSTIPGQKPWIKAGRLGLAAVPLATWKSLPKLRQFLIREGVELINAHTGKTHTLAVTAALGLRIPVVRTRSDARPVQNSMGSRFLYPRTIRIIAAADYIRQDFITTLELPSHQVVTIMQGVDTEVFTPAPLPEPPVIGIVARLDPVKGHRYLFEALALLRPQEAVVRLKVIGQPENIKEGALRALAARWGVERFTDFLGYQSNVASVMQTCSIGVIASTGSEAVSRVALEWMACGRPLVATRVGCLPEVVSNRQTGILVDPKDPGDLAKALATLLNDPVQAQAMGRRARQRVEERFSLPVFIGRTEALYAQAWREQHV